MYENDNDYVGFVETNPRSKMNYEIQVRKWGNYYISVN
jgi:hypothetical protein